MYINCKVVYISFLYLWFIHSINQYGKKTNSLLIRQRANVFIGSPFCRFYGLEINGSSRLVVVAGLRAVQSAAGVLHCNCFTGYVPSPKSPWVA